MLLVDELFERGDAGFVAALRSVSHPKLLAAFAARWNGDTRPWARAQLLAYLEQPLDGPGHQALVKRLYKAAEARGDEELLAAFVMAFDVLIRRVRVMRWRYDRQAQQGVTYEELAARRDVLPREVSSITHDKRTGDRIVTSAKGARIYRGLLFTHRTRQYLRRRAWRKFKVLAHKAPERYVDAVLPVLRRYRDADLMKGENILDSRVLLEICHHGSPVLSFGRIHVSLTPGRTLGDLQPAPRFPALWAGADVGLKVFRLLGTARSKFVRLWAMSFFNELKKATPFEVPADELLSLLAHPDETVQAFAASLLPDHKGLGTVGLPTWLKLLRSRNLSALVHLCSAFERHVAPARLSVAECVQLACLPPVPVARLGLHLLSSREITKAELPLIAKLADATCPALAGEIAAWAIPRISVGDSYQVDLLCRFFDSLSAPVREAARSSLVAGTPGHADPVLWSRLSESPFADIHEWLVDILARRSAGGLPAADKLETVWCSVLLGVHRGGRSKPKAIRALADAIGEEPARAPRLLPVLGVAVRSVRGPEMRAGLSAVMTLLSRRPELSPLVSHLLPEVRFGEGEGAA